VKPISNNSAIEDPRANALPEAEQTLPFTPMALEDVFVCTS